MLIDLQLHSTYSDGYLTPTELVKFIASRGVKAAALTDHNTVGGLDEFRQACQKNKIIFIAGLELYVKLNNRKLNLLWYNFNDNNPELHQLLRDSHIRRRSLVRKFLKNLNKRGFKIEINKVLDKYTHYIPVNRIAGDILASPFNQVKIKKDLKNINPRETEIIKEYFNNKREGILRESYLNINKVLKLRKKIGGQLIFNHPGKHSQLKIELLKKLKKIGIDGLEAISPHHSIGAIMYIQYLARKLGLITTGGSDFHRFEGEGFPLQSTYDYFKVDSKKLRGVKKIIA